MNKQKIFITPTGGGRPTPAPPTVSPAEVSAPTSSCYCRPLPSCCPANFHSHCQPQQHSLQPVSNPEILSSIQKFSFQVGGLEKITLSLQSSVIKLESGNAKSPSTPPGATAGSDVMDEPTASGRSETVSPTHNESVASVEEFFDVNVEHPVTSLNCQAPTTQQ